MGLLGDFNSQDFQAVEYADLVEMWESARGQNDLPHLHAFKFEKLTPVLDRVMYCDVRYPKTLPEFVILFHGERFKRIFGKQCFGRPLSGALPEAIRQKVLADYQNVALSKLPLFSSSPVADEDGGAVLCQRSLLPLTIFGKGADRIVCVLNLKSATDRSAAETLCSVKAQGNNSFH